MWTKPFPKVNFLLAIASYLSNTHEPVIYVCDHDNGVTNTHEKLGCGHIQQLFASLPLLSFQLLATGPMHVNTLNSSYTVIHKNYSFYADAKHDTT